MKRSNVMLAIIVVLVCMLPSTASAQCYYQRFEQRILGPGTPAIPWCTKIGWCPGTPGCTFNSADACPTGIKYRTQNFWCSTGEKYAEGGESPGLCPCDPNDRAEIARTASGKIVPGQYGCDLPTCNMTSEPEPERCDGTKVGAVAPAPVDTGCGAGEHCDDHKDGAPVKFNSGRVQSNPITLFSLPMPDGISLDYTIVWGSHVDVNSATATTVHGVADPVPTIHHFDEVTHFVGSGWQDSFSDRLLVNLKPNQKPDTTITWLSTRGTVTFTQVNGWKSWNNKYELIDRCLPSPSTCGGNPNPPDGFGRWMVRETDTSRPRRIWTFEQFSYVSYGGPTYTRNLGRLRRHAVLTSNLSDMNGRFGYTINWTATGPTGVIQDVVDTIGRRLVFVYQESYHSTTMVTRTLRQIQYKASSSATPVTLAELTFDTSQRLLDRVSRPGHAYTRFVYWKVPVSLDCARCGSMLTHVLAPSPSTTATPLPQAPALSTEIELEYNEYDPLLIGSPTYKYPLAKRSRYAGHDYAYEHRAVTTTQFDLLQDQGACSGGGACSSGAVCRVADNRCYSAIVTVTNPGNRVVVAHGRSTGSGTGGGTASIGNPASHASTHNSAGRTSRYTDPSGTKMTYGADSLGRTKCIVRGDDDDEAFANPLAPDTSPCAGPSTAQIVRIEYGTNSKTTTTPSMLSGNVVETVTYDSMTLLPTSMSVSGKTRDITGTLVTLTKTTTKTYDSSGRVTEVNGPLNDSTSIDKTAYAYYTTYDSSWPHNFARLQSVTRYKGTQSSNIAFVTTYAEYDLMGVPRRVTAPDGSYVTLTPSSDRLTWTINNYGIGSSLATTRVLQLAPNGRVRSFMDGDGVCTTYEYLYGLGTTTSTPVRIRRSNTACGVLPIDVNDGEVQLLTYVDNDSKRLSSIETRFNGQTQSTQTGFTYHPDKKLAAVDSLDSTSNFTFDYTDVILSSIVAPSGPSAGSWRTDQTTDALSRPAVTSRFMDASNKQTTSLTYANPLMPLPSQIARGFNGSSTSISTFVYDDFGRVIESVVPEGGTPGTSTPTRFEYDPADNMIKRRVAVGTSLVRTEERTYDALGRVTFVDNDTEHPVNCSTAPAGTPIQDVEYEYDTCATAPSGFSCTNGTGRLTSVKTILRCESGTQVRHGRWYASDHVGRLSSMAYASVSGTTIGTPVISDYQTSAGGRLLSYTSPLNPIFGIEYTRGAANGAVTTMTTLAQSPSLIANDIEYRAFSNSMITMKTGVSQPVGNATRLLRMDAEYRSDDVMTGLSWSLEDSDPHDQWGASSIALLEQDFELTPAGAIKQRTDSADIMASRYYGYDALLRLTCEARGKSTTQPSVTDCNGASPSTRTSGIFTYGDGQSASSPADARLSAVITSEDRSYRSNETYSYAYGSTQVQSADRYLVSSDLVVGHDARGFRTHDYDSLSSTTSRRDYTYLPNGQLGSITGVGATSGLSYVNKFEYDERGRPIRIIEDQADTTELFWDEGDRLVAAEIIPNVWRGIGSIRWHYHYAGPVLVAATREVDSQVKRFWAVSDDRGLIHRMIDEQGATFWQARWDAFGSRTLVGLPQAEMWVPFGLPGQVLLAQTAITGTWGTEMRDGTEAYASSTDGDWTRFPLALNQWRVYDPLTGGFLQPDGEDVFARRSPEGYAYGRSNPIHMADPNGMSTSWVYGTKKLPFFKINARCNEADTAKLSRAIAYAYMKVLTCDGMECRDQHRREWLNSILNTHYTCSRDKETTPAGSKINPKNLSFLDTNDDNYLGGYDGKSYATPGGWQAFFPPNILNSSTTCVGVEVAHEAYHYVVDNDSSVMLRPKGRIPAGQILSWGSRQVSGMMLRDDDEEEAVIDRLVLSCFGLCNF